jgi:hypothetical protein
MYNLGDFEAVDFKDFVYLWQVPAESLIRVGGGQFVRAI